LSFDFGGKGIFYPTYRQNETPKKSGCIKKKSEGIADMKKYRIFAQ
jgi:hypothetical protein